MWQPLASTLRYSSYRDVPDSPAPQCSVPWPFVSEPEFAPHSTRESATFASAYVPRLNTILVDISTEASVFLRTRILIHELGHRNEHSKGSGLGLYIVKETVEKLNGVILVQSELNKGTQFRIKIPNLVLEEA